jgi:hypothetical protein
MASARIDEAFQMNGRAVAEYVAAALDVSSSKWLEPLGPGKWSPAQVTEHLAITYELGDQFLDGQLEIPGHTPPRVLRPLLRMLIRATVLRTGKFLKSKTPVAFELSSRSGLQRPLCDRLQRANDTFEQGARDKVRAGVDTLQQPYFGRFGIEEFVRLEAYHTWHHRSQIL